MRGIARETASVAGELWADGRGPILVAVSAGQLVSLGVRLAFPALLPQIKAEFAIDNAVAGLLLSVLWVSFATAQLPGGILTDRLGERDILVGSMAVSALGVLAIAVAPAFAAFVLGLVVFGFGSGLYGTPRLTVLSDVYPDRAATAISLNSAVGNLGNATFPVVATVIAGWFSWRAGVGITLPGFVLIAAGFWLVIPPRTSPAAERPVGESPVRAARRIVGAVARRPVLLSTGAMICLAFVWQGFTAFLPTYLIEVKGIGQRTAATTLGAFFVGGAVIQPAVGGLADRYDERRLMAVLAGGAGLSVAAFPFAASVPAFLLLSLGASLQLAFWPLAFAYVPRALPDEAQGSGFGLLRTAFIYVGATGSIAVGAMADAGLFDAAFLALAGIAGVALALAARLPPVKEKA